MTITVTQNVSGDEQESTFMNSCLSVLGEHSISIAVRPPSEFETLTQSAMQDMFLDDFQPLIEKGYSVEIQTGLD
ncbi:hypothetical protein [Vibrio sp. Hal054]|uniref:hypothetical protein n=1 Tax=Vibrio sp. Hal054 TaxID=3035158 RepID=UPI00301DC8FB